MKDASVSESELIPRREGDVKQRAGLVLTRNNVFPACLWAEAATHLSKIDGVTAFSACKTAPAALIDGRSLHTET
jgi:hypothetical protein